MWTRVLDLAVRNVWYKSESDCEESYPEENSNSFSVFEVGIFSSPIVMDTKEIVAIDDQKNYMRPTVVNSTIINSAKNRPYLNRAVVLFFGIIFLLISLVQFILEGLTISNSVMRESAGVGFWCGVTMLVVAISCFVLFAKKDRNGPAIANLMLSSVGMAVSIIAICFSMLGVYWSVGASVTYEYFEFRKEQIGQAVMSIMALVLCTANLVFVATATFSFCKRSDWNNAVPDGSLPPTYRPN
ncbi:hypothetical protein Ciccas_013316 [Cichlidogyrus casuarinus]|uniref:Uncharacterized protein n=1 Tax=Cichlidogyrus casuarinus TaxID=1844966 RepID=A0ABD2PN82_9PLAT